MDPTSAERVALLQEGSAAARRVFVELLTHPHLSRTAVARSTGLSQSAVTKAVAPLIAAGIVEERAEEPHEPTPGRPVTPVAVVADALLLVGIKINADELFAVVTDLTNHPVARLAVRVPDPDPSPIIGQVVGLYRALVADLGGRAHLIAGLGVAVSGDVDTAAGVVRGSALMGWHRPVVLGERLQARIPVPVTVDNDVRALTMAEHWFGVGVDTTSFAIVTMGRGVGCGLHLNGEVVRGAHAVAGEIGHLPLTSPANLCPCGRRGCVEAVAGSAAVTAAVGAGLGRMVGAEEAVALARAGEPVAVEAFEEAGRVVGAAIACVVNLVGPEVVLICGEAVAHFDLFERSLRSAFREHAFGAAARVPITARADTFDDWARGAAATALQSLVC